MPVRKMRDMRRANLERSLVSYIASLPAYRRLGLRWSVYFLLAWLALGSVVMAAYVCVTAPWGVKPIEAALNATAGAAIAGIVSGVCACVGVSVAGTLGNRQNPVD